MKSDAPRSNLFPLQVLVVPIGNNSLFNDHFQVVSNLRDVPFYELNRPPAASNANSAFKHFNWNDGNLLFDFQRYDRVLIGPGDLNNFQVPFTSTPLHLFFHPNHVLVDIVVDKNSFRLPLSFPHLLHHP